jgi:DNA polymerase III subunit epsilon
MELNLKRPLAFFDLESTGLNVAKDRIVEISIVKVNPNKIVESKTWLLNPDYPISEESASVHGYTNEMVADKPTFKQVCREIDSFLKNCDLAGYNVIKFDLPMLVEEFLRSDLDFEMKNRRVIDVQNIFMKMEQRTLAAACKFYLGKPLENAHSAEADTMATFEVLKAQLDMYDGQEVIDREGGTSFPVKNDTEALAQFSSHHKNVDLMGQFIYNEEGKEVINFGKHKGRLIEEVFEKEPSYYSWIMNSDFPLYTKKILTTIKLRMSSNFNQVS